MRSFILFLLHAARLAGPGHVVDLGQPVAVDLHPDEVVGVAVQVEQVELRAVEQLGRVAGIRERAGCL